MSRVMVDNWFMEEVLESIAHKTTYHSRAYAELLMAIVLWDEICYPKNDYSWWNSIDTQVQDRLTPIDDLREEGVEESIRLVLGDRYSPEDELWKAWHGIPPTETEIVATGAIRYMLLSSKYDCDYLPCSKRKAFLKKYVGDKRFYTMLKRFDEMKQLDKAVESFIHRAYPHASIKVPSLVRYIFDRAAHEGMSPIDFAFHLREEGPVVRYREHLHEMIQAYGTENARKVNELQRCDDDAIADVLSIDPKTIKLIAEIPVVGCPKISIEKAFGSASASISPSRVKLKVRVDPSYWGTIFLSDLAEHAISNVDKKELFGLYDKPIHIPKEN